MAFFIDQSGAPFLPVVDAGGNVPVADHSGDDAAPLLLRLVWELAELRRVTCETVGELFREYPGP